MDVTGGGPDSGSGSGDSGGIESFLSSAYDSAAAQAGGDPSPVVDPAAQDSEIEASDPDAQPSQDLTQAEPEVQAQAGEEPFPLSPDGLSYVVPKASLPELLAARDFHSQVSQFFSSPTEAHSAALQASDMRQMSNDWAIGTPQSIRGFLDYWSGANATDPGAKARFSQSLGQMAQMLPDVLSRSNPQAFQALSARVGPQFLASMAESAYQHAAQTGDPADLLYAQNLEWTSNGGQGYRANPRDPAFQGQNGAVQGQSGAVQASSTPEMRAFQAEKTAFEARQSQALNRDLQAFNSEHLEGAKYKALGAKIDKLLEPAKSKFSPVAFEDLKAGVLREINSRLESSPDFWTEHAQHFYQLVQDYKSSWAQGSPAKGLESRIQSYISEFSSRASRDLPSIVQKRLAAATSAKVGKNGAPAVGRTPQNSANQRPASVPSQTPGSSPSSIPRLSSDDWDKALREAMTVR